MEKRRRERGGRAGRGWMALAGALLGGVWGLGCNAGGASHEADTARATLPDRSGERIGEVSLRDTPNGVLMNVSLEGPTGFVTASESMAPAPQTP